jgi:hypothetical protein
MVITWIYLIWLNVFKWAGQEHSGTDLIFVLPLILSSMATGRPTVGTSRRAGDYPRWRHRQWFSVVEIGGTCMSEHS